MKQVDKRDVRLPILYVDGEDHPSGVTAEEAPEVDLMSYVYSRRVAVPTLDEYVIGPFSNDRRADIMEVARETVGFDEQGILADSEEIRWDLENMIVVAQAYERSSTSNEGTIRRMVEMFDNIKGGKEQDIRRDGVIQDGGDIFVQVAYVMAEISRFMEEETTRRNDHGVDLYEPGLVDGKLQKLALDDGIREVRVVLNPHGYAEMNASNATTFHEAKSLKARNLAFQRAYEAQLREQYDIPSHDLGGSVDRPLELSDESHARFLFYSREAIAHGKILSGLFGDSGKNKSTGTGDLDLLLAFALPEDDYHYSRGGYVLDVVSTPDASGTRSSTVITRTVTRKGSESEGSRKYDVLSPEGRGVYVRMADVVNTMMALTDKHTTQPTHLKLDFFPAAPDYLR
tara:strand:- start:1317 stop:2516 length:1200 start_codon:yes stop_codon:yes gene_type:complete